MENLGIIDGYIRRWIDMFTFQFHLWFFIIRCNSFFNIATVVILASFACLGTAESLFSAATSETTTSCGTVTVDHFQECFGCRVTVQHDGD